MAATMTMPTKAMMVYAYIVQYKQEHDGNSPTYRQIAAGLGYSSVSVIQHYLNMLSKAGLVKMENNDLVVGGKWTPPREMGVN